MRHDREISGVPALEGMAVVTEQGVGTDSSQKAVTDFGGVGVVTGVAGNLSHRERSDLLIQIEEGVVLRSDGVIGRSGMGVDCVTEKTEEVRLRQEITHLALGSERRPLLDDVAELTSSELADLEVDIAPFQTVPVVTPETDTVPLPVGCSPEHVQVLRVRRPVSREVTGLTPQGTVLPELPLFGNGDRIRGRQHRVVHMQSPLLFVTPAAEPRHVLLPERSGRIRRTDRRRIEGVAVLTEARGQMGRYPQ